LVVFLIAKLAKSAISFSYCLKSCIDSIAQASDNYSGLTFHVEDEQGCYMVAFLYFQHFL